VNNVSPIDQRQAHEALEARFAARVTAALTQRDLLQPRRDIEERLRVAREQSLGLARAARRAGAAAPAGLAVGGGALALGGAGNDSSWWLRLSSLIPLAVLVAGLVLIDRHYTRTQIEAAADVDAALLADDVPPDAYRDPGFAEFLKVARQ
jgi:hypothetical protein